MRKIKSGRQGEKFVLKMCFLEELKGFSLCRCVCVCLCEDRLFTELFYLLKLRVKVINLQYLSLNFLKHPIALDV